MDERKRARAEAAEYIRKYGHKGPVFGGLRYTVTMTTHYPPDGPYQCECRNDYGGYGFGTGETEAQARADARFNFLVDRCMK